MVSLASKIKKKAIGISIPGYRKRVGEEGTEKEEEEGREKGEEKGKGNLKSIPVKKYSTAWFP